MTERCELCGDEAHPEPDTEGWDGLFCPGVNASPAEQQAFRSALAEKFAAWWETEARTFFAWEDARPARNAAWDARTRAPVSHEVLQADATARTQTEVARQKREAVWQPEEVELPAHLTVKGSVPAPRLVQAATIEQIDPDTALLYVDPSQDVP